MFAKKKLPTPAGSGPSKKPFIPPVQAKLTLGQPGDVYEREADRTADAVVSGKTDGLLQTQMEEEEMIQPQLEEEEEEMIQPQLEEEEEPIQAKLRND